MSWLNDFLFDLKYYGPDKKVIILALVVVVLIALSLVGYSGTALMTVSQEVEEEYVELEEYTDQDCEDIEKEVTEEECGDRTLSYSITDFKVERMCSESECLNSVNDECVAYRCNIHQLSCSLKLSNDDAITGTWNLSIRVFDANKTIKRKNVDEPDAYFPNTFPYNAVELVSGGFQKVTWNYFHDENRTYDCEYKVEKAASRYKCGPVTKTITEQECTDVTRYRNATKTRTVTQDKEEPRFPTMYGLLH